MAYRKEKQGPPYEFTKKMIKASSLSAIRGTQKVRYGVIDRVPELFNQFIQYEVELKSIADKYNKKVVDLLTDEVVNSSKFLEVLLEQTTIEKEYTKLAAERREKQKEQERQMLENQIKHKHGITLGNGSGKRKYSVGEDDGELKDTDFQGLPLREAGALQQVMDRLTRTDDGKERKGSRSRSVSRDRGRSPSVDRIGSGVDGADGASDSESDFDPNMTEEERKKMKESIKAKTREIMKTAKATELQAALEFLRRPPPTADDYLDDAIHVKKIFYKTLDQKKFVFKRKGVAVEIKMDDLKYDEATGVFEFNIEE